MNRCTDSRDPRISSLLAYGPIILLLLLALLLAVSPAVAQRPAADPSQLPKAPAFAPPADEPEIRRGDYVGLSSCANGACHGAAAPREGDTILGNEYTSRVLDPHYRAYSILRNRESADIANALEPGKKAWQIGLCLDCHTVNIAAGRNRGLYVDDGISCEGCHGAGGGWWDRHYEDGWTHQDSVRAGLRDLGNLETRASVCMSCHVGTSDQAVDHRLIAAGHPVLKFELDNYTELRDLRHWKSDNERGRRSTHGLRAWAVGQAAAMTEGLDLLAHRAEQGQWPEFAEYTCSSCHHTVGEGAWRERPGYEFNGGLPPWSPARWTVLRHLVSEVEPGKLDDLERRLNELASLVATMGNRQQVASNAAALADDMRPLLADLQKARFSRQRVEGLIGTLASQRHDELMSDEASARQVALSLQSLSAFLVRTDRRAIRDPRIAKIDDLFEILDRGSYDGPTFVAKLEELAG